MTLEKIIQIIKCHVFSIILAGLLVGAIIFLGMALEEKNYQTDIDILITQNQNGYSDYYSLSRSADYLSSVLIESIYSERFLEEMGIDINLDSFLPNEKAKRLEKWKETILVTKQANLGIVNIKIFSKNQSQAQEISNIIVKILTEKYQVFLGKGQTLDVRLLNGPIIRDYPELEKLILLPIGGGLLGAIIFIFFLVLKESLPKKSLQSFSKGKFEVLKEEELKKSESLDYWSQKIENEE